MGSGRDKRKKAKGKVPGHGDEKTARKTELNQTKAERRTARQIEVTPSMFHTPMAPYNRTQQPVLCLANSRPL